MRRILHWWERFLHRRRMRRRMDDMLASIERRTPVLGRPEVEPFDGETWDDFVARMRHSANRV